MLTPQPLVFIINPGSREWKLQQPLIRNPRNPDWSKSYLNCHSCCSSVNESCSHTLRSCRILSSVSSCYSLLILFIMFPFSTSTAAKTISKPQPLVLTTEHAADSTCGVTEQIIGFTSRHQPWITKRPNKELLVSPQIQPTWPCSPWSQYFGAISYSNWRVEETSCLHSKYW